MEKIVIFGAGNTGRLANDYLKGSYNCVYFVDNDSSKWGTIFCGKQVLSPEKLKEDKNIKVIIASVFYAEILIQIEQFGLKSVEVFEIQMRPLFDKKIVEELKTRTIDLGELFHGKSMKLKELTFITGGSGVLDYALLRYLAIKYNCRTYLEIGTYIGESINILTDVCETLYSVTAPMEVSFSMKNWCKLKNIPDFSERLTYSDKIKHFFVDSKKFDFTTIQEQIDLYFIDGDHSYNGVLNDTKNIFNTRKKDSIVVWHDFKLPSNEYNTDVVQAVKDVLKDDFKNVYVTNNNMCGIYIPEKYAKDIPLRELRYEENAPLYTYDVLMEACRKPKNKEY